MLYLKETELLQKFWKISMILFGNNFIGFLQLLLLAAVPVYIHCKLCIRIPGQK